MKNIKRWFWSKTRLFRYGVPICICLIVLFVLTSHISPIFGIGAVLAFIAMGVIIVEDGGTVVAGRNK